MRGEGLLGDPPPTPHCPEAPPPGQVWARRMEIRRLRALALPETPPHPTLQRPQSWEPAPHEATIAPASPALVLLHGSPHG